jgi:hypothetical protein
MLLRPLLWLHQVFIPDVSDTRLFLRMQSKRTYGSTSVMRKRALHRKSHAQQRAVHGFQVIELQLMIVSIGHQAQAHRNLD